MCDQTHYPIEINDLYPGTTFHFRKDSHSSPHLCVILTNPENINDVLTVVFVNVTTQRSTSRGSDSTVILNTGDHHFIKHPSVVSYKDAQFYSAQKILRYINEEKCLDDDLEENILKKIQQGLLESRNTPYEIVQYCQYKF